VTGGPPKLMWLYDNNEALRCQRLNDGLIEDGRTTGIDMATKARNMDEICLMLPRGSKCQNRLGDPMPLA